MTRDAHPLRIDLSLRASGIVSLAIAGAAIHALVALASPTGALAFLFAATGFLGASGGAMLLVLGRHIHDPIRVSARWRRNARPAER